VLNLMMALCVNSDDGSMCWLWWWHYVLTLVMAFCVNSDDGIMCW